MRCIAERPLRELSSYHSLMMVGPSIGCELKDRNIDGDAYCRWIRNRGEGESRQSKDKFELCTSSFGEGAAL